MVAYFLANVWQFWLLVALVCLILELTNGDLYILCFSIGGVCTAAVSVFTDSFVAQVIAFSVFSLLSIVFIRPVALRWLHKSEHQRLSNADALVGRVGIVSEAIAADGFGRVAIDGDDWKCVAVNNVAVAKGMKVRVVGRESIILTVEPVQS